MGSAWAGDYNRRITAFAESKGHQHIWGYLREFPTPSLVEIANAIGDVAAVQINGQMLSYCLEQKLMREYLLDGFVRAVHEYLPGGWGTGADMAHAQALSSTMGTLPEPYGTLRTKMTQLISRGEPPPSGWLPRDIEDTILIAAYDQALDQLAPDKREMVALGKFIRPPGSAYSAAISSIWKEISIYEGAHTFLEQYAKAPEHLGHLFAMHWCQSEVRNGGFHQFFTNSTGVVAPEALEGFQAIGMKTCALALAEAMEFFGREYPRDREGRREFLQASPDETVGGDLFDSLNDKFYLGLKENGGFDVAADNYAKVSQGDPDSK